MRIGLDLDKAVLPISDDFKQFIKSLRDVGHRVFIVSSRPPAEMEFIFNEWFNNSDGLIFTSGLAKGPYVRDMDMAIDTWIVRTEMSNYDDHTPYVGKYEKQNPHKES